jgi:hypothetical protein
VCRIVVLLLLKQARPVAPAQAAKAGQIVRFEHRLNRRRRKVGHELADQSLSEPPRRLATDVSGELGLAESQHTTIGSRHRTDSSNSTRRIVQRKHKLAQHHSGIVGEEVAEHESEALRKRATVGDRGARVGIVVQKH